MRKIALLIFLPVLATGVLTGLHVVFIGSAANHKACIMAKDSLSFDSTFISADSILSFAVQHPIIASRIAAGHGWCAGDYKGL